MKIVKSEVRTLGLALRAYNHEFRQRILALLMETPGMTVTELTVKLRCPQPVASQHLAALRGSDFVRTEPDGKYIRYFVKEDSIKQLKHLAEHWDNNTTPQPPRSIIPSSLELMAM